MNWDVNIWRTRDQQWRARLDCGWRSNEYATLPELLHAVGNAIANRVWEAA